MRLSIKIQNYDKRREYFLAAGFGLCDNMGMKIIVASFQYEACGKSAILPTLADFECAEGEEIFRKLPVREILEEIGAEVVPVLYANALPGGILPRALYEGFAEKILSAVRENRDAAGIYLCCHGSSEVAEIGSGELELVRRIRAEVGEKPLIAVSFDLHANIDVRLVPMVDIICGYKTAPHTDQAETQRAAARLLADALKGGYRPVVRLVKVLPDKICAMSNSEEWLSIQVGEVEYPLVDYTVSQSARAPGEYTRKFFAACDRTGLKKFAKIQLNTSWECCAAPFFPVFESNRRHIDNLLACGVDGLVLGWTLGGYPSPNMEYFATRYRSDGPSYEEWISATYGEDATQIKRATKLLSDSFSKFPFTVNLLYNSPVNIGTANPFYNTKTGMQATMTGYPYDDIDDWIYPFRLQDVIARFEEMCAGMDEALAETERTKGSRAVEWKECAEVLRCNMKSTLNQMKYISIPTPEVRRQLIEAERELTERTLKLLLGNCALGFEASNHYYWDINLILEKLICLDAHLNEYSAQKETSLYKRETH